MNNVYLAFYKGRKTIKKPIDIVYRLVDWFIRLTTKGQFSHVEIAIHEDLGLYTCYSSSNRDGGVRCTEIDLMNRNWELIEVDAKLDDIMTYFEQTQHQQYDLLGTIASTIPFVQFSNKQFCSEWCFNALKKGTEGWRFSPNDLFAIYSNNPNNSDNLITYTNEEHL